MYSTLTRWISLLALVGLTWACAPNQPKPPTTEGSQGALRKPTQMLFAFPKEGKFTTDTFYDFPYPNDARLDADGSPSLSAFPAPVRKTACAQPTSDEPLLKNLLDSIDPDEYVSNIVKITNQQTKGFSVNPTITIRFSRPLDPRTLPPLSATITEKASVYLVNIGPNSPNKGRRIPIILRASLDSRFLPGETLIARPYAGFVLQPSTPYALVVTTAVTDTGGWPLAAHPDFLKLGEASAPADPELAMLHKKYAPLFAYLKEQKIAPTSVAAATVFTTGDPVTELRKLRSFIRDKMPAPTLPTNITCEANSDSTPYVTCTGTYEAPQFQVGTPPYLGDDQGFFTYDKDGNPNYTMTNLRFALTIPKRYLGPGALVSRPLPVTMYAHGTGGTFKTFISNGTARRLAEMGIAGFGIDQAVNGDRTIDIGGTRLDFLFFNAINIPAARDNVRQSAADYYWQTRLLKNLQVDYKGQTFAFDANKLWFMGHSQGGLTGPLVLALEDDIKGAYLSAPGGFLIHTLLYKSKPTKPILLSAVLKYLVCEPTGDPIDVFHPILGLVQHFYDSADPVTYSPLILSKQRTPLNLLMTEGMTDGYAPPEVFDPLATAMRLPLLGPLAKQLPGLSLQSVPAYKLPITKNYQHPSGEWTTVGFTQHKECKYSSGSSCDGHFVAFYNQDAMRNWTSFFQSLVRSDIAQIH